MIRELFFLMMAIPFPKLCFGASEARVMAADLVLMDCDSFFYGTSVNGGVLGEGDAFYFDPVSKTVTNLYSFGDFDDTYYSYGNLIYDPTTHYFYGMAQESGG